MNKSKSVALLEKAAFWCFDENSILPFGKFKGKSVQELIEQEPAYLVWCLNNIDKFTFSKALCNRLIRFKGAQTSIDGMVLDKTNPDVGERVALILNKCLEVERVTRENAGFVALSSEYAGIFGEPCVALIQEILFVNADKLVFYSPGLRRKVSLPNGDALTRFYPCQESIYTYSEKKINLDKFIFSIKLVPYTELPIFRKYEVAYLTPGVQVFEIVKPNESGVMTVLVVTVDWSNTKRGHETAERYKNVIPEDSDCINFILNQHFTAEFSVGLRPMTEEEINAAVAKQQHLCKNHLENSCSYFDNKGKVFIAGSNITPEEQGFIFKENWNQFGDCEQTIIELENNKRSGKKSVMQAQNFLDEIVREFVQINSHFPNIYNLINTQLSNEKGKYLTFSLDYHDVVSRADDWYATDRKKKRYEYLQLRMWVAHCEQQRHDPNDYVPEFDYDKEAFDAMTDGQEGFWEDS